MLVSEAQAKYDKAKREYENAQGDWVKSATEVNRLLNSEDTEKLEGAKDKARKLHDIMDIREKAMKDAEKDLDDAKEEKARKDKEHEEKIAESKRKIEEAKQREKDAKEKIKAEKKAEKEKARQSKAEKNKDKESYCKRHPKVCKAGAVAGLVGAGLGTSVATGGAMGSTLITSGVEVAIGDKSTKQAKEDVKRSIPESEYVEKKTVTVSKPRRTASKPVAKPKTKTASKPKTATKTVNKPKTRPKTVRKSVKKESDWISSPLVTESRPRTTKPKTKTKSKTKAKVKKRSRSSDVYFGSPLVR